MTQAVLALNAGSSSLKFALFAREGLAEITRGVVEDIGVGSRTHAEALASVLDRVETQHPEVELFAAGHRVVHGGREHVAPERVTPALLADLERLVSLAPLHQPHNLSGIRAVASRRPDLPQVACFDTAFHATIPEVGQTFALPFEVTEGSVVRYGFHGISYAYIASVLPRHLRADQGRVVVAHLGHGASLCAMRDGRSVATTMGFTPLDGIPMSTRCGSLDPGVLIYLLRERGLSPEALTELLYHRSGLLGVSGISRDMKTLLASSEPRARLAVDLFVYWLNYHLGGLCAVLGGLDALVFTAGIGERSPEIRGRVCEVARWLGVGLDPEANARGAARISRPESAVSVLVIPTHEELAIARGTCEALAC